MADQDSPARFSVRTAIGSILATIAKHVLADDALGGPNHGPPRQADPLGFVLQAGRQYRTASQPRQQSCLGLFGLARPRLLGHRLFGGGLHRSFPIGSPSL